MSITTSISGIVAYEIELNYFMFCHHIIKSIECNDRRVNV